MRRPSLFLGAVLGGLTSLPLIALAYLGKQLADLPFVPFDLFDWLARVLPGGIVRSGIDAIVRVVTLLSLGPLSSTAKRIEQWMGILLVIVGGAIVGFIVGLIVQVRNWAGSNVGSVAGLVVFLFIAAVEVGLGNVLGNLGMSLLLLAVLIVGWGDIAGHVACCRKVVGNSPRDDGRIPRRPARTVSKTRRDYRGSAGGVGHWPAIGSPTARIGRRPSPLRTGGSHARAD
jgi:hypothetical protein